MEARQLPDPLEVIVGKNVYVDMHFVNCCDCHQRKRLCMSGTEWRMGYTLNTRYPKRWFWYVACVGGAASHERSGERDCAFYGLT